MKKNLIPVLLVLVLAVTACGTPKTETETPEPTATTIVTEESVEQPTGGPSAASEENPCVPFSLVDQKLTSPYPGLPEVTEEDWILGPVDAPVTFMEYSEPQCPFCAQIEPILSAFQAIYPEDVRLVFRYRPFQESFHDKSILGSQAMEAAGMQGKFQEFKNWLFEQQSKNPNNPKHTNLPDSEFWVPVPPDQFDEWLVERVPKLGIDAEQFREDMFSDAVVNKIKAAKDSADQLAINGTPTLFINGYQWPEDSRGIDIFSIYTKLLLNQEEEYETCPEMVIDTAKTYTATIQTTKGDIQLELFDDTAPYAVNSFVFLANQGWYQDLPFLATEEFALSGDPSDTGYGGPGYAFKDEISEQYNFSGAGMLASFSLGPNINGSSFFITKTQLESQEGRTIFGRVTEGMEIVNSLAFRNNIFAPVEDTIINITITES